MTTTRLESFCDGVFGFAATLLVLRVTADAHGNALGAALRHAWPQYATYVLSFLMIGIWWVNHHAYLAVIDRADRAFLFGNVGFLVFIAFLPYPTYLVAEHFHDGGLRAAVVVYGLTQTLIAACLWFLWSHASRGRRLIAQGTDDRLIKRHTRDVSMGVPANGMLTLIAFWSPYTALALIAATALFYVVGGSLFERP
jgi:uncharacterized membrane protein